MMLFCAGVNPFSQTPQQPIGSATAVSNPFLPPAGHMYMVPGPVSSQQSVPSSTGFNPLAGSVVPASSHFAPPTDVLNGGAMWATTQPVIGQLSTWSQQAPPPAAAANPFLVSRSFHH